MRSIFGWDLPPGCSMADIERSLGPEPSALEDDVLGVLDGRLSEKRCDKIMDLVREMENEQVAEDAEKEMQPKAKKRGAKRHVKKA